MPPSVVAQPPKTKPTRLIVPVLAAFNVTVEAGPAELCVACAPVPFAPALYVIEKELATKEAV